MRILGASSVQSCFTLYIYRLPAYHINIVNSDLLVCGCRNWISYDIACLYEEQCQPSSESTWPACPENIKSNQQT